MMEMEMEMTVVEVLLARSLSAQLER